MSKRVLLFTILSFFTINLYAQPSIVTFQGVLKDSSGNKINGNFSMTFNFYESPSSENPVYGFTPSSKVEVVNGVFSVNIDLGTQEIFKEYNELWIGIKIEDEAEFPKIKISSVGYAIRAKYADQLLGKIGADNIINGSITSEKLAENSVNSNIIENGTIRLEDIGSNNCAKDEIIKFNGNSWVCSPEKSGIAGTGQAGFLAKFKDDKTVESSVISEKDGKIGIGAANPEEKLVVEGNTKINGNLIVTGSILSSSGPSGSLNFSYASGESGNNICQGANNTWVKAPYNSEVSLYTYGGPVLILANKRQYKQSSCNQRGHITVKVDGKLITDSFGYGLGSSYECNAIASFSYVMPLKAGFHTFELWEKAEGGGVCSDGKVDSLFVLELNSTLNNNEPIGSSQNNPGLTCKDIKLKRSDATDGIYWIDPDGKNGSIEPFQVYCDMTIDGGGWTRFFWLHTDYPEGANPFGKDVWDCNITDDNCLAGIPSFINPKALLVKDLKDNTYAAWKFNSNNNVSNAVLHALKDREKQCIKNGNAFQPYLNTSQENYCGTGEEGGCDSFFYTDGACESKTKTGVWGVNFDGDTCCWAAAFKFGDVDCNGQSNCPQDADWGFLNAKDTKDEHGELFFRE